MRRWLVFGAVALLLIPGLLIARPESAFAFATVVVNPNPAPAGLDVTVNGAGFDTLETTVTVCTTVPGVSCQSVPTSGIPGGDRSFSTSLIIPLGTSTGLYQVCATGAIVTGTVCAPVFVNGGGPIVSPSIIPSPGVVSPGGSVCVSGTGFTPFGQVNLVSNLSLIVPIQVVTATAGTTFQCFTNAFVVPVGTPSGVYTITATDVVTSITTSTTFTVSGAPPVNPSISPSNGSVSLGGTFVVFGNGFHGGVTVSVCLQTGAIFPPCVSTVTLVSGSFNVTMTVPLGTPAGSLGIRASEVASPGTQATTTIQIVGNPTFTLSINPVQAGQTFSVVGTQFTAGNANVQVVSPGGAIIATQSGSVLGGSVSLPVTIPVGTAVGSYTVQVYNNGILVGQSTLQVTGVPTISFSPAVGTPGGQVTILGTGFPQLGVNLTANFTLSTGAQVPVTAFGAVSASGTFSTVMNIPSGSLPGSYTVTATTIGNGSVQTSNVLLVQSPASITVNPSTVAAGGSPTVVGTGFGANEIVQVALSLNGTNYQTVTGPTNASGTFTLTVPVPSTAPPGAYTATATGQASRASAQTTVSVTTQPILNVNPNLIKSGNTVTLSGQNWAPNSTVNISATIPLVGGTSQPFSTSATTDSSGNFSTTATIPATSVSGNATFTGSQTQGASNVTATASIAIEALNPEMDFATTSVQIGTSVQVSLSGFAAGGNAPITITAQFPGGTPTTPQSIPYSFVVYPNTSGNVTFTLSVPGNAQASSVTVTANQQSSGASASNTLNVTAPAPPTPTPPPPPPAKLKILSASVKFGVVREGTSNTINVTVNEGGKVAIRATVSYPNGQQRIFGQNTLKTDSSGHGTWQKTIPVPGNALGSGSGGKVVLIQLQVIKGSQEVTKALTFRVIK